VSQGSGAAGLARSLLEHTLASCHQSTDYERTTLKELKRAKAQRLQDYVLVALLIVAQIK
jgi:hypothetical protein